MEREVENGGTNLRSPLCIHFLAHTHTMQLYWARKQQELELKKKQTEERKAKLMKELGGGLQYTALSMASRAGGTGTEAAAGGRGGGTE